MRRVLLGVMVFLLAGCQDQSLYDNLNLPPQYRTAAEVRDALDRAGLGCAGFRIVNPQERGIGGQDAIETAACRVQNTDASIVIWRTLGEAQDWARSREIIGCQFAESLGDDPPVYVDGGRWAVALKSRPVATTVADAIGGKATFTDCRAVD